MASADCVELQPFEKAVDFVRHLRPSDPAWASLDEPSIPWIFRGQSDARWTLLPSAWREENGSILEPFRAKWKPSCQDEVEQHLQTRPEPLGYCKERIVEHMAQVAAEIDLVREFGHLADELGYPVPELDEVKHYRPSVSAYLTATFPTQPEPNLTFALAQHHGIPTCLLDWTRRALVAAFFAADGVKDLRERGKTPTHLAVWALNLSYRRNPEWKLITCPRHQFAFLHAQDGLHTWHACAALRFLQEGVWPSLEDNLGAWDTCKVIRKITLPVEEAQDLLRILWRERITRAHLMPTYDNIARSLFAKWAMEPRGKEQVPH
ncbi:MAG: FRG domain-containing protein [Planctomycetes bacterium]|nr:FRG domain-containing protein [Planctomycetota bacterium]